MVKNLVLFGAGASFGSGSCEPKAPPLGKDLFAELESEFLDWATLPPHVKTHFAPNFEPGFVRMREEKTLEAAIPKMLRQMALYFLRFYPRQGNLYRQFAQSLRGFQHDTVAATLNYEGLLETALEESGIAISYERQMLVTAAPTLLVLKIHGSPNFLPLLPPGVHLGGTFTGFHTILEARCRPIAWAHAEHQLKTAAAAGNNAVVPAMALYAPGKDVLYCRKYIENLQQKYADICSKVKHIYVVGASHSDDKHVWNPISQSSADLTVVDPSDWTLQAFGSMTRPNCPSETRVVKGTMKEFVSMFATEVSC